MKIKLKFQDENCFFILKNLQKEKTINGKIIHFLMHGDPYSCKCRQVPVQ